MRASHAASGFAIALGALLVVPHAFAHHSFAPHFDSSKPANISGTITEFEARNPHSYLHIAATDENGRTREYVCESHGVTQLSRNGIRPDDAQGRHEGSRDGIDVASQRLHVLLRQRRVRGRPHAERQWAEGCRITRRGTDGRRAQRHLRHLAARADTEPEHERSAADDSVPHAGW